MRDASKIGYSFGSVHMGLRRAFNKSANDTLMRLETGTGLTNPEIGISLDLLAKTTGMVDKRRINPGKVEVPPGSEFLKSAILMQSNLRAFSDEIAQLQLSFSRSLYTQIRKAYRGSSSKVSIPPLKASTIRMRKARGNSGTIPYYETGAFLRNGLKHDTRTGKVYFSKALHPKVPGKKTENISYFQIYVLNEYGYPDRDIIPRPVVRPITRALLREYLVKAEKLIHKYLT